MPFILSSICFILRVRYKNPLQYRIENIYLGFNLLTPDSPYLQIKAEVLGIMILEEGKVLAGEAAGVVI